ncbi:Xaa-Pro peptidase family protein [uncultured Parasphingorhabdus sp.]|uniref:M24 family metallopeptidase n=1 Tax=uncultured Parasphingorhabdus sp. TaxID=2709694 RepID=UPI002AA64B58|nr:Xaa-Pro peptidase family protein [uncultured Parasphingorhabdus sp.]
MKTALTAMGDLPRLCATLEDSPYDAIIASSPENIRYTADVMIDSVKHIRDRLAFVVWPKGRDPVLILCHIDEAYVRQKTWIQDVRGYREFFVNPIDLLVDVLSELGLANGRVGMELEYFAGKYLQSLEKKLPQLSVEPCDEIFRKVRSVKTAREITALQEAFRGTERAMFTTFSSTQVGETEYSLSRRLADAIIGSGAEMVAFNFINAGANTGFPHAAPTDYQVQKGDIVKADSGGWYSGAYPSNVGRTAKMGKPTAQEADAWKSLREIHHTVADMLRPGNTGAKVFDEAVRLHEKHGLPFPFAHNGHSIGLELHEYPMIKPHSITPFEPGMVCTVETRIRKPGEIGLHMEDLYLVTDGKPELLSDAFDNEEILVI